MKLPDYIEISKRLRSNDGVYKWWIENTPLSKVQVAHKHLYHFGMDSLIKVLKHEIAHHICCMKGFPVDHGTYFKDLCLEMGACLSDHLCYGKYSKLSYDGIDTPYLWEYKCPKCHVNFKTKRSLNKSGMLCAVCGYPITHFDKRRL